MTTQSIDSQTQALSVQERRTPPSNNTQAAKDKAAEGQETNNETLRQVSQRKLNVAILQSNREVSLSVKNEPLALVYKTAIEAINKELEPELGENSIQKGYEAGIDVSPEATADRIVSFSTGLFSLFQQQHPSLSEPEQVDRFLDVIGGGIDQGFSEARDILEGLGVLKGEIADNIDKTYDLVQEGLSAFRDKFESTEKSELVE